MSAALVVLPQVWATVETASCAYAPLGRKGPHRLRLVGSLAASAQQETIPVAVPAPPPAAIPVRAPVEASERGNYAFYRKYTEAMLHRSMKMSLEVARVPSFMGRSMFRARITSYKIRGFDDVVNFVADIDNCVTKLEQGQQHLVRRIGMQQYTHGEVAAMTGTSLRTIIRRYNDALDDLTRMFLQRRMMEPMMSSHDPRCEA